MASFQVTPPEQFNFCRPDEWPKWVRRFERFRETSGLSDKPQSNQVNALGGVEVKQEVYVVRDLHMPLIGRPAIEALGLLVKVDVIDAEAKSHFTQLFPQLFQGLGKLQDQYHIKLKDNAQPFALTVPRRVARPLLPKVKEELEHMEAMGVISKVDEPTDRCAGLVVVPKSNGQVRICVDLTKLNESVCQERHLLPSVEQILAQLGVPRCSLSWMPTQGFGK